jgi:hypothetical protein
MKGLNSVIGPKIDAHVLLYYIMSTVLRNMVVEL